jgi:hypothetical protein
MSSESVFSLSEALPQFSESVMMRSEWFWMSLESFDMPLEAQLKLSVSCRLSVVGKMRPPASGRNYRQCELHELLRITVKTNYTN